MPNVIDNPYCKRCSINEIESIVHKYILCGVVRDAWNFLRELMKSTDQSMVFETDHSLLNLYYEVSIMDNAVLWLIGEYISYVESEVLLLDRKISRDSLQSHLKNRFLICRQQAMPDFGFIPGLFATGVG